MHVTQSSSEARREKVMWASLLTAVGTGLLLLPGALRLRNYQRTSLDGVVSMRDAVELCRRSGLQGWDQVAFAQELVARKFAVYSTLNLWDPPGRAFAHGSGYCTQYNLALARILERLGFQTRAVFARKVQVFDNADWSMGHTWLKVTIDGETRDVCAGRIENRPGVVRFRPLTPVREGRRITLLFSHLGLIPFVGMLEWKAFLTGAQPPEWTYRPRTVTREGAGRAGGGARVGE